MTNEKQSCKNLRNFTNTLCQQYLLLVEFSVGEKGITQSRSLEIPIMFVEFGIYLIHFGKASLTM